MPVFMLTSPEGKKYRVNAPEGATQEDAIAYVQQNNPQSIKSPPEEKGFLDRVGDRYEDRVQDTQNSLLRGMTGQQSSGRTALQMVGSAGIGFPSDILGEGLKSAYNVTASPLVKEGFQDVSRAIMDSPVGRFAGKALGGYKEFAEKNPALDADVRALGNIGSFGLANTPIRAGKSAIGLIDEVASPIVGTAGDALKTVTAPIHSPIQTGAKAISGVNKLTDSIAGGISNRFNRANLGEDIKNLPDADALFVKSLQDEGISPTQALKDYSNAKNLGVSPSLSVTSNIPSMQTQGYLTSRGSAGSKVSAQAIKDIDEVQIPKLNMEIINKATGSASKSAEEYGNIVSQESKKLVDSKIKSLQTRAKPYYEQSVGLDKSVPTTSTKFQKVLGNPLARRALDDYRTDPYTLTNVQRELSDLGVVAEEFDNLPYNSTISLHGARTHLRQAADAAFSNGEKQKGAAIKTALNDIDAAIEETYPSYKTARRIYSEDSGALKTLKDSPVGKMSTMADGNYSKIANDLMTKDPAYIKKFVGGLGSSGADQQKIRDSLAGAFLKRQLEESANSGRRFSDSVFRNEGNKQRLKALVGEERFDQISKIDSVIDDLLKTRNIPSQSITAAAQSMKEGVSVPLDKAGLIDSIRKKIAPSLFEQVQKNPASAARYNELLFTDEGYKLLESLSSGSKASADDYRRVGSFLEKMSKDKKPLEVEVRPLKK